MPNFVNRRRAASGFFRKIRSEALTLSGRKERLIEVLSSKVYYKKNKILNSDVFFRGIFSSISLPVKTVSRVAFGRDLDVHIGRRN